MNKNWNDRADKDLFFTILSVKNIGVISGAEWTTIGNHMRSLGYGFTNEGCRQHFQGLRRAQNKAEITGSPGTGGSSPKVDPTQNPITRRPGPGRGRPRKQPLAPGDPNGTPGIQTGVSVPIPGVVPAPIPGGPVHAVEQIPQPSPTDIPTDPQLTQVTGVLAVDPSLESVDADDDDEPSAKRQRLTDDVADTSTLTDEAMLSALAAHSQPDTDQHQYNQDFNYGEA
ncbi:hypothetical protein GQ53DRAFT_742742 [Thozetella sp. PMI_491]|nr:hypothetical protein GQ53DRAFT_742742 [Thozetella sp. PMI_491]